MSSVHSRAVRGDAEDTHACTHGGLEGSTRHPQLHKDCESRQHSGLVLESGDVARQRGGSEEPVRSHMLCSGRRESPGSAGQVLGGQRMEA